MDKIAFQLLQPNDRQTFELIAGWYVSEWNIPVDKTINRLPEITADSSQFQVVMTLNDLPVATGGIYNHVGIVDKEPRFGVYKNWLALVYTIPAHRKKGYGASICHFIQDHAKSLGLDTLHLFTDTAERLYERLGWKAIERVAMGERSVVVMEFANQETIG
jgi:GNAT superfamily N-acetyltransferase